MSHPDFRDIAGSGLLFTAGLVLGLHALAAPDGGETRSMGPGALPLLLATVLALLGGALAMAGPEARGKLARVNWHATGLITLGLISFALTIPAFGMVPAVFLLTLCAALADGSALSLGTLVLASVLSALAYLVFSLGLGIAVEPFRWPL